MITQNYSSPVHWQWKSMYPRVSMLVNTVLLMINFVQRMLIVRHGRARSTSNSFLIFLGILPRCKNGRGAFSFTFSWRDILPLSKFIISTSHNSVTSHTNFRSPWGIDLTITSNPAQSPNAIEYHNLPGGYDTQSHMDFDPDAFERRSSSHQSISHETACTMCSHSEALFKNACGCNTMNTNTKT